MAQSWAVPFYKSAAWLLCRAGYIQSVMGLCERCGSAGLIVHHRIVLTPDNINNPAIALNWEHLELVCMDCHNKEHHGADAVILRDGLMFTPDGDVVLVGKRQ